MINNKMNNSNVTASNVTASNVTASNVNSSNVTASNVTANSSNVTVSNVPANINSSNVNSSNVTASNVTNSNVTASSVNNNVTARNVNSNNNSSNDNDVNEVNNDDDNTVASESTLNSLSSAHIAEIVDVLVDIIRTIEHTITLNDNNSIEGIDDTVSVLSEPDLFTIIETSAYENMDNVSEHTAESDGLTLPEVIVDVLINIVLAIEHSHELEQEKNNTLIEQQANDYNLSTIESYENTDIILDNDNSAVSDALAADALTADALTADALTADALTADALTADALITVPVVDELEQEKYNTLIEQQANDYQLSIESYENADIILDNDNTAVSDALTSSVYVDDSIQNNDKNNNQNSNKQLLLRSKSRLQLEHEREKLIEEKRLAQEKMIDTNLDLEITGQNITKDFDILVIDEEENDEEVFAYHYDGGSEKPYDILVFDDPVENEYDIVVPFDQPIPYDETIFSDQDEASKSKLSDDGSMLDQGIFSEKAVYEGNDDSFTNFESTTNYIYEDSGTNSLSDRNIFSEKGGDTYEDNTITSDGGGFGLFSEKGVYEAYDDNMNWDDENASQMILGMDTYDELKALEDESSQLTDALLKEARVQRHNDYENEFDSSITYLDNESLDSNKYETINLDELSMYYDEQGKDLHPSLSMKETITEAITDPITPLKVFQKRSSKPNSDKKHDYGINAKESPEELRSMQHLNKLSEQLWNGRGDGVYKSTEVEDVKSLRLRKLGEEKNMAIIEITAVAEGKDRCTSPLTELRPDYKYLQMKERLKNVSREIDPTQPSLPSITASSTSPNKSLVTVKKVNKAKTKQIHSKSLPRFDTTYKASGRTESLKKGSPHAESKNEKVQKMYDAYGGTVPSHDDNKETKRLKDVSMITIDSILNPSIDEVIGISDIPMGVVSKPSKTPQKLISNSGDKIELHTISSSFITNIYKNPLVVSVIVSKKSVPLNNLVPKSWDPEMHLLTYYSLFGDDGEAFPNAKVLADNTMYPERVFVKAYDPAVSVESVASINLKECTTLLYSFCRKYTSAIAPYFPITDINWWSTNIKHFIIIKGKPNGGINLLLSKALMENFCSRIMRGLGPSKHPFELALSKPVVEERKIVSPSDFRDSFDSLVQHSSLSMPSSTLFQKDVSILEPWRPPSPTATKQSPPKSKSSAKSKVQSKSKSPTRTRSQSPVRIKGNPNMKPVDNKGLDLDEVLAAIQTAKEVAFSPSTEFLDSTGINGDSADSNLYDSNNSFFEERDDVDSNMILMQTTNQQPETNVSNDSLLSPSWRKMDIKEVVARSAIVRARAATSVKSAFRTRKLTDVEISLFTSPFAEPLLKPKLASSERKEMIAKMVNDSMSDEFTKGLTSSAAHRKRGGLAQSFHMAYGT